MISEEMEQALKQNAFKDGKADFDALWLKIEKGNYKKEAHMADKKGGFKIFVWILSFMIVAAIGWFGLTKMSLIKKNEKIEKGEAIVVTLLVGNVQVKKMGSTDWRLVNVEDDLQMGDAIKTASDSYCELQMVNRGIFRIEASSELFLSTLVNTDDKVNSRMKLTKGTIALKPSKLKQGENFEVETSTAVAAVRGTKFIVNVDDQGNTRIAVNEGKVAVKPVIRSINSAQEKGIVNEKASEILDKEIVRSVDVRPGEEVNLNTKKIEALDKSIEKVIDQVAQKEEGKVITEDTLAKVTVEHQKQGRKTVEKSVTGTESIVAKVQQDIRPEMFARNIPLKKEDTIMSTVVQKQVISEESKNKMDELNENKIINKVADMVKVRFETTPAGADVYVDNVKVGVTPAEIIIEKGKRAYVKLSKEGFTDVSKDLPVDGDFTFNMALIPSGQETALADTNAAATNLTENIEAKKLPGQLEWEKPIPLKIETAYKEPVDPVLYKGKIFVTKGNRLFVISTEGKLLKSVAVVEDGYKVTKPSVSDGIVYVGSDNGGIFAYSVSGELLWKKDAGSEKYGAAPAAGYGIVAIPSIDKGIMIYDKTGALVAQIESDSIYSAPLLLNKGKTLVYATESGNIVSYDIENKTQNWSKSYNERFLYPLVGDEAVIALARSSGKVIAVKPSDGSLLWSAAFTEIQKTKINPQYVQGKVILANNAEKSVVIVLNVMTGKVLSKTTFDNETITMPYLVDKEVYFGTESGKVYSYDVLQKKNEWTYKSSGSSISLVVADKDGIYALSPNTMYRLVK